MRPIWQVNIFKKFVPRKFSRNKLLEIPQVTKFVDKKLFEGDDMICLPKDQVISVNKSLDGTENMVLPSHVADHFIEKASFHWLMNFCICRDAVKCKDYPIEFGCLFLGEAARGINPELGRAVSKDEALDHARRCRDAGLVHFVGRSKLDTVWLKIGPGDRLFTICSCCPCCCITRGVPYIPASISDKISKMPGVTVAVNEDCEGCGKCEEVCFTKAIKLVDDRAVISDECRACGRCASVCPNEAIEFSVENASYVNDVIARLSRQIDVT